MGLARDGHRTLAGDLSRGLLSAAAAFDYRVPELFGGDSRSAVDHPVPYPAACRPQAWSAASSVALITAALGLRVDAPSRSITVEPIAPAPFGALRVQGLRVRSAGLSIETASDGRVIRIDAPRGLEVINLAEERSRPDLIR
jgi:glycogen debranching enzyme